MNKLNKLVTNYPVELTPEEVGNLSLTLSAVRTAGAAEEGKIYKGDGFVNVNNTNNTISLTTEANEKLNQPIPTKVSDLTDSANYQTTEGMNDYLTKTSASENLAPLSVTADIESLKNVSGDFSLYYNKNETSSTNELSSEFVKYVTTTEFNGVNVDVSTLKSASSEWNKVGDKLDKTAFSDVSGNFLTAAPENMATTDDVAKLEQTISETYQVKGEYLTTADSSNFYPSNNPSGFITGVDLSNYYEKNDTSSKNELDRAFGSKQDNLTQEQLSAISSVSSIKGTILTGDSNIRATSAGDGNNIKWTLELTAQPTVTDTTLSGYHGLVATKDSTVSSQWNVGIEQAYKEQIEAVSSKLTQDVADTLYAPISVIEDVGTLKTASAGWNKVSDKLDTTSFSDVSGNFLTAHQDISNKLDTSAFSAVSGNFLTDDDLNAYATKIDLETTSGKLLTTAQYKTDSATFLTAHQNLDAYSTKEYANNASANALSQAKTWVESQNYLKEVPNTYATKTDLNTASSTLTGVDNALSGHIDYVSAHTITSLDDYYTKTQVDSTFASATQLNNYLTTSQYNTDSGTFALKTEIPKTVSQLTDSGNYYQKSETSGKTELTNALNTKVDKPSQTGKLVYDGDNNEWVTLPEGTTTIVQGQGSITSNYDASNSTYTVSLLATAENALNKVDDKIDTTAVAQTYQTKEDMSNYLTTSVASTTYQPIGDYASKTDINDMATQTWVRQQGFYTKASADNDYAPKAITATVNTLTGASASWNEVSAKLDSSVASTTYQTKADMEGYLTKNEASTTYQPTGNYLVANDITGKLDKSIYSNASGKWENASNVVVTNSANWNAKVDQGVLDDYYEKTDTSSKTELSTEFAKYQVTGDYATQSDISDMATKTWVGEQGFYTKASGDNDYAPKSVTSTINILTAASAGWNEVSSKLDVSVASATYQTKEDMNDYLTKSDASTTYQPIGDYLVSDDITGKLDKSIYSNASGNWENTYNTVNQYSAEGTWLTAHQSLTNYYTKSETSGANELADEFTKYVTSSTVTTQDTDYVMTTTGWKELTLPGGGMTQVIHDETLTGQGNADNSKLGLAQTAYNAITSVSSKLDTSSFSTVSSTFLTKSSADNDYAPISITTTVNTLTVASAGWNEVSAKLGTAQYATDSAKFVTSSSNTITGTKQYALTTAGWAEVSTPTVPDITATSGISADGFSIGLTNTAIGAITSVSSKVDIPDTTQTDLNNNYLIYSTLTDPGATTGWMPLSANYYSKSETNGIFVATANIDNTTLSGDGKSSDTKLGVKTDVIATKDYVNSSFLPLSGGTVSGEVTVSSSGTCLLAVGTEATLMGQSRVVNMGDTTARGTNWLGVSQSNAGFIKYVNGGNVGDLEGTSIQINFAPDGANSYGNITVNSQDNMSKIINVPTASYNSMSSFDSTNGPNYMLRKTASGFDIGAAVINVTELPQQIEANAYYFVYDT